MLLGDQYGLWDREGGLYVNLDLILDLITQSCMSY